MRTQKDPPLPKEKRGPLSPPFVRGTASLLLPRVVGELFMFAREAPRLSLDKLSESRVASIAI